MDSALLCLATVLLGIDVGWQPLPGGGMEYIIQVQPQTLDVLKAGELIQSDVPAEVRDIRAYRIVAGTGKLPRQLPLGPPATRFEPRADDSQQPPSQAAPQTLPGKPAGKPISAQRATFVEPSDAPEQSAAKPAAGRPPEEPSRPGMMLMLVALGLFASLGGNVYLAWTILDVQRRYRALLPPAAARSGIVATRGADR